MTLIPAKDFLNDMARKAADLFLPLGRGDVVAWENIEQATGVRRYSEHWASLRKKLRVLLLRERGIAVWAVVGVGLKLCTEDEQLNLNAIRRQRRAARQCTFAIEEVSAVPSGQLSPHRRRLKGFMCQRLRRTRLELRRAMREERGEARKTQTNPRRPMPSALTGSNP